MIETDRLILRGWHESDKPVFLAMCNDPEVMRFLGPPLSAADVDAAVARQNGLLASVGHCFWAVERRSDGAFLGFCGIKPGAEGTPIEDDIEIGWRFARDHWGRGYACEAAAASLVWGWSHLDVREIAAITTIDNVRSWGLMERLGMRRAHGEDFDHPQAIERLKPHITYRIARPEGCTSST
jgi:RimJ/RimL family protein N-acetyltransferase